MQSREENWGGRAIDETLRGGNVSVDGLFMFCFLIRYRK